MNVFMVEEKVIESVAEQFRRLTDKVEEVCDVYRVKGAKEYLDNQDVCLQLNISKRTLQNYRNTGKLPFTRIGQKIYYRTRDIEKFLNEDKNLK
ncbi:helix-turn-helix domain-containing protein [Coprobacter sp. LH1063]|uniref:Helix-turn-helix domain-containing protein n=2 Tax=Coprobacter tertius TaxID=2944915 RepID=A0ABT1MKV4_9BACT|nr:helix-turn-helix domain-containing protein [Coprobacter tertius]